MTSADLLPWYRLGYVSPHPTVDTLAYELYRMAPPGLMVVTTGVALAAYDRDAVEEQLPALRGAIEQLRSRRVNRIVVSGVPLAAALGRERMQELLDSFSTAAGVPVDTDLEAIIAGLRHLGVARVALATRWQPDVTAAVAAYLGGAGVDVVDTFSDGRSIQENAALDDATGMRLALELGERAMASTQAPDGVVMPGGRWVAIHVLEPLEAKHGRPLFLNFAAALWAALHAHGYRQPIRGWGRLLASLGT